MTSDDTKRRAALTLLRRGHASPSEVAALAGVSRQLVRYWLKAADLDWHERRNNRLQAQWDRLVETITR